MLNQITGHGVRRPPNILVFSLLLCLCISKAVYAEQKLIVISSSDAFVYQQAVKAFEQTLHQSDLLKTYKLTQLQLNTLKNNGLLATATSDDVIVTIGSAAASYASQYLSDTPILCSFITRNAFTAITAQAPKNSSISAVFMDQSLKRLLNLATLLRGDQAAYKIGLLSQSTQALKVLNDQENYASENVALELATLQANSNPMKVIEPLMKSSDIFIVRPNTSLFNRLVAKLVLQLSMRYKTPVIGFSKNYAQAGALLSLYASPEDIGKDTAQSLKTWLLSTEKNVPEPSEGQTFSIVVNPHIAAKMAMKLAPETLKRDLRKMEEK